MKREAPLIVCLDANGLDEHLDTLARILHRCVHDGASVGFVLPFTMDESVDFWTGKVRPCVVNDQTVLMVAKLGADVAGTVQLVCATPPNQPHRADASKLLVDPAFRRRGVARTLMRELEHQAGKRRRSLITLDTRTGDKAEPLYSSLGYTTVGVIPNFCRDTISDRLDGTTVMFKQLEEGPVSASAKVLQIMAPPAVSLE